MPVSTVPPVIAMEMMAMMFLLQAVSTHRAPTTVLVLICDHYVNRTVDCSHKSLGNIPNETFPVSTKRLDLSYNTIQTVQGFTFHRLTKLVELDLSNNRIHKLERHAFQNLHQLNYLNLNTNDLNLLPDIFPKGLFQPLQALKVFHFEDNHCGNLIQNASYPREVATLTNLVGLYTDFPRYVKFGEEFAGLHSLEKVSSSGFSFPNRRSQKCCITRIKNMSFTALSGAPVKLFQLSNSCLREIEADALLPFKMLDVLKLNENTRLGFFSVLQAFHGLQHKNFTFVSLSQSNNFTKIQRTKDDFYPNFQSTRFLRTTSIKSLDISGNFLHLPYYPTLTKADCLEELDMSIHSSAVGLLFKVFTKRKIYPNLKLLNISRAILGNTVESQSVSADHYITPNNSLLPLRVLDASFIPMKCDYENIQFQTLSSLNISGWNCSVVQTALFLRNTNLTHLSIRQAKLNGAFRRKLTKGSIFRNLRNLEWLDLSDNELTYIPDDLLLKTSRLKILLLHNNNLTAIPIHVFETTALRTLELSSNAMQQLTDAEIQTLHGQRRKDKTFRILLASNPWVCSCATLSFLQWLNQTDHVADFGHSFMCRVSNGSDVRLVEFMENFKDFSVSCVRKEWLKIGIVFCLLVIPLILGALFYYRRRYNIHYWFYSNCRPSEDMLPKREYEYDAFVAYNQNDGNWVHYDLLQSVEDECGLRLCVHQRNFPAGEPIHQNIVDSINNSRKILLVISQQFVRSTWGEYEIEMAAMRSVQEGRSNVIVCVMLEEIPVKSMPRSLLNLWHRVTFLEWPGPEGDQSSFGVGSEKPYINSRPRMTF